MTNLRFFVLGDFGDATENVTRVAESMSKRARTKSITCIFGLGDNFYPHGLVSSRDVLFRRNWELVFLKYPSLYVKWYMTLGNHDYEGDIYAQIGRPHPFWTMPARTYSVRFEHTVCTVEVFVIDTNPSQADLGLEEAQLRRDLAGLDRALSASSATVKFVCAHHPVFTIGRHHQKQALRLHALGLYDILIQHRIDAYFSGHEHVNAFDVRDGVPCFVAGCTSYTFHDRLGTKQAVAWHDERPAFLEVDLHSAGITFNFVDARTARVFFTHAQPYQEARRPTR